MQVHVAHADITNLPVDAIVNPVNSKGIMGDDVSLSVREYGGIEIEDAVRAKAPIAIGAALVTKGFSLPAKYIIHTPTAEEPGAPVDTDNVRRAARAALLAANIHQCQVMAIPGMGAVKSGVPLEEAARAIVDEIRAHKKAFPETVYLVDTSQDMVAAFEEALYHAQRSS